MRRSARSGAFAPKTGDRTAWPARFIDTRLGAAAPIPDMNTQPRVSPGVPAGGQYTHKPQAEPGDVLADSGVDGPAAFSHEGAVWVRRQGEVYPTVPYSFALRADRPITDEEMRHMASLAGYAYAATIAGERLGEPHRVDDRTFIVAADTTKSARDDLAAALDQFEQALPGILVDGSPVRTTDRAGVGTRGTRLVPGMGPIQVAIYYDETTAHDDGTIQGVIPQLPPDLATARRRIADIDSERARLAEQARMLDSERDTVITDAVHASARAHYPNAVSAVYRTFSTGRQRLAGLDDSAGNRVWDYDPLSEDDPLTEVSDLSRRRTTPVEGHPWGDGYVSLNL